MRRRSTVGAILGISALLGGTAFAASTAHRAAITTATGSKGAYTILQTSATNSAFQGEVAGSARTSITIPFGVLGEYDAAGSTFGIGVAGISTTGYGVGAESFTSQPSLLALNSSGGTGAEIGSTTSHDALDVENTGGGYGMYAYSSGGNSIASFTDSGYAATYSEDDASSSGYGDSGVSYSSGGIGAFGGNFAGGGVGVYADAEGAVQGLPAIQAVTYTDGTELFDAGVNDTNTNGNFSVSTVLSSVSMNNSGGAYTMGRASSDLQINGDIYITGAIYTNCTSEVPYATAACADKVLGSVRSSGGSDYQMYASEHASKTVEDEGEASLRGGVAHIALDPAFASVLSKQTPYLVFTTPQGDTRGLYVTNRTATGFDVRETGNGRSSLTFDYRIVGHPYGEVASRMAIRHKDARSAAGAGLAHPSKALADHQRLVAHIRQQQLTHKRPTFRKAPADFAKLTSFMTR